MKDTVLKWHESPKEFPKAETDCLIIKNGKYFSGKVELLVEPDIYGVHCYDDFDSVFFKHEEFLWAKLPKISKGS